MISNYYYKEFFELGQQYINFNLYEIGLPLNPIMMFSLIIYANIRGIRAIDQIVGQCERDAFYNYTRRRIKIWKNLNIMNKKDIINDRFFL